MIKIMKCLQASMKCAERMGGYLPSGKVLTMSLASLGVMSLALPNVMISLRETMI